MNPGALWPAFALPAELCGALWRLGWKLGRALRLRRDRALVHGLASETAADPASAKIVRVGSLLVGGGGRTTVARALARLLSEEGIRTALLCFDRKLGAEPARVDAGASFVPGGFGDDALLLARSGVPAFASGDMLRAAARLRTGFEVLVLDGGLEDPRLDLLPGIETVVLRPLGRRAPRTFAELLPFGRNRSFESDHRGARFWTTGPRPSPAVARAGDRESEPDVEFGIVPPPRPGERIRLVTGVGNPRGAARLLRAAGAEVAELRVARDHSAGSIRRAVARGLAAPRDAALWLFAKDAVKLGSVPEGAVVADFAAGGRRLGLFAKELAGEIRASGSASAARRKKRVAVLGGAFDPVHVDHVRLARECLEWKMADEVRFVVAPDVRWDKRTVAGAEDRLEMVRLATEGMENVVVSREEIDAGEYRGSLRMLERLVRNDPGNEYALVVGSDSYPRIPSWRDQTEGWKPNGEELLRRFSLMVWPRPGAEMPDPVAHREKGYAPLILPPQKAWTTASPVSSTRVRELLGRGESADALLPPAVAAYVARKGLYRTSSR